MAVDYGRDTSCSTSRRTGRISSGRVLLAEAAFRRLTTPRGRLRGGPDEQNYGIDLLDVIGSANPRAAAAALPGQIATELLKDERILEASATVTVVNNGPATELDVLIFIEAADDEFTLRLKIDEVTVSLLGISEA